ncbi:MAG: polysaccharide export protein [Gammaproteobacteria bacterium]|nr:polysaccharide export protein [Gammaproteobacteria bacterium]
MTGLLFLFVGFLLAEEVKSQEFGVVNDADGSNSTASGSQREYRIDTGDLISINVYDEEDLSLKEVRIGSNGKISFPLLGEISVRGLSARRLEEHLVKRLKDGYLKKPAVTVSILRYRMYFIKGEVKHPGGYSYVDGLTVHKAVALAGGFTLRADEDKLTLVREDDPDNSLDQIKLSTQVMPGDVITIGESFF